MMPMIRFRRYDRKRAGTPLWFSILRARVGHPDDAVGVKDKHRRSDGPDVHRDGRFPRARGRQGLPAQEAAGEGNDPRGVRIEEDHSVRMRIECDEPGSRPFPDRPGVVPVDVEHHDPGLIPDEHMLLAVGPDLHRFSEEAATGARTAEYPRYAVIPADFDDPSEFAVHDEEFSEIRDGQAQ